MLGKLSKVYTLFLSFVLFSPFITLAETKYISLSKIPFLDNNPVSGSFPNFLNIMYKLGVSIASVLAIVYIFYAGFMYTVSSSSDGKSAAKARIQAALGGLLLALSSFIILSTINPQLVEIRLGFGGVSNSEISATVLTAAARENLKAQAVAVAQMQSSYEQALSRGTIPGVNTNGQNQPIYVLNSNGTASYQAGTSDSYINPANSNSLKGIPIKGQTFKWGYSPVSWQTENLTETVRYKNTVVARGKGSHFGGPNDSIGANEHGGLLAGIYSGEGAKITNLNPNSRYVAIRWDYAGKSKAQLKNSCLVIINESTGERTTAAPVDRGPSQSTGKSIDMSLGAAKAVGSASADGVFLFYLQDGKCQTKEQLFLDSSSVS